MVAGVGTPVPGADRTGLRTALEDVLTWMATRVGFAEASVMAYDPDVLVPVAFAASASRDLAHARSACRNEQFDADIDKFRDLAARRRPVAAASLTDPRTRGSARWAELIEPAGHQHELRAALVDRHGRCWGAISLLRDHGSGFTPPQVAAVAEVTEAIATAIARAMVLGEATSPGTAVGSLWPDDQGQILFATDNASRWLTALRATEPLFDVEAVLAGITIRTTASNDPLSIRIRVGGGWATLHAERVVDPDGRPSGVAMVVQPAHPGTVLPLAMAAFGLTPRETAVTREVMQGKDTRATAAALRISEYTVQDHLKPPRPS